MFPLSAGNTEGSVELLPPSSPSLLSLPPLPPLLLLAPDVVLSPSGSLGEELTQGSAHPPGRPQVVHLIDPPVKLWHHHSTTFAQRRNT